MRIIEYTIKVRVDVGRKAPTKVAHQLERCVDGFLDAYRAQTIEICDLDIPSDSIDAQMVEDK